MAWNPLSNSDPFADLFQQPAVPTLKPEEEDSLLSQVTQKGLGGLHFVAGSLGKALGGRAIRGALRGKPRELASIIPFSDTLGITNEADEVKGEDLAKQWGLLEGEGEKGTFEPRDLVGPGLEVALDPATYLTFGTSSALTGTGKAAAKAGQLAPTMAGRIAAGQAGLMGVGLPFAEKTPLLTGPVGESIANKLGQWGDKALYSAPGRTLSEYFDPNVSINGTSVNSEPAQRAARQMNAALKQKEETAYNLFLNAGKELEKGGALGAGKELRAVIEGTASPLPNTPTGQAVGAAAGKVKDSLSQMLEEAHQSGRQIAELEDKYAAFGPRQRTVLGDEKNYDAGRRRLFGTKSANAEARIDPFRDIPGATAAVNALISDPQVRQLTGPGLEEYIRNVYLGWKPYMSREHADLEGLSRALTAPELARLEELRGIIQKSEDIAGHIPTLSQRYVDEGLDYFGNHALTDFGTYALRHARGQAAAEAVHDMYAGAAQHGAPSEGMVSLAKALQRAGLTFNDSSGVGAKAVQLAKLQGKGVIGPNAGVKELKNVFIPEEIVKDAERLGTGFHMPESLQPVLKAWDSITNLTKAAQTSLWPAFHARNALTGLWQNFVIGAKDSRFGPADPRSYLQPFLDANALRKGQVIPGANTIPGLTHLNDADATKALAEELMSTQARVGIQYTHAGEAIGLGTHEKPVPLELPGRKAEKGVEMLANPLNIPKNWREEGTSLGESWWPLNTRGVGKPLLGGPLRTETKFGPVKIGQDLGAAVDDVNRTSAYIALRRQGYDPMEAALKSKAAHYDYTKLTGFEREVMRRVFPFYNWTRQNMPFQLQQLAQHPGGATANTIKVSDRLREQAGFVPDYIEQGMAIPIGKEENGNQRFLSHLGLPFEDLTSMVGTGEHPVLRTGEKLLGQTNPLIKGPLETMTGKQFYSGRELEDLYGPTGTPALDQLIMNSPLARAYTSGRTLLDERKGLGAKAANILGPAKVTDVDMEKQRQIAGQNLAEEMLKGNKNVGHFEEMYVKPENLANLTPEEFRILQLYKTIEKQRQEQAKAKKPMNIGLQLK